MPGGGESEGEIALAKSLGVYIADIFPIINPLKALKRRVKSVFMKPIACWYYTYLKIKILVR